MAPSCLFIYFFCLLPLLSSGEELPRPCLPAEPPVWAAPSAPLRSPPAVWRPGREAEPRLRRLTAPGGRHLATAIFPRTPSCGRHLAAGQARPGRRHFGCGHGEAGGAEVVRAGAGGAGKSVQKALF